MVQAPEIVSTDDNEALLIKLVLWQENCLADYHYKKGTGHERERLCRN